MRIKQFISKQNKSQLKTISLQLVRIRDLTIMRETQFLSQSQWVKPTLVLLCVWVKVKTKKTKKKTKKIKRLKKEIKQNKKDKKILKRLKTIKKTKKIKTIKKTKNIKTQKKHKKREIL